MVRERRRGIPLTEGRRVTVDGPLTVLNGFCVQQVGVNPVIDDVRPEKL